MNPKLKHMADMAAKYAGIMALPTGREGNELFVEKLAELVIDECVLIALAYKNKHNATKTGVVFDPANEMADRIAMEIDMYFSGSLE